jgi:hypothetical protein|tara:strand:+ start:6301 stop:6549 length:249 start_codon:yes stop_codon:yes gene_type:complete
MFLAQLKRHAKYWADQEDITCRERCDGVIFSILNIFDGTTMLPAMDIVLRPHPDDKAHCQSEGLNWYEDGMIINSDCMLHEI